VSARERSKGRRAEREVERLVLDAGIRCDRSLGGRRQPAGDLSLPGVAVEVRRRNRLRLLEWSREHETRTPQHLTPAIAYRADGEPWRVSVPLNHFLDLLRERTA
jgi:hypothetical protein